MSRDLTHGAVGVGEEPTLVCTVPPGGSSALIQNVSDTPVFVGGHDVAVKGDRQGLRLDAGEDREIQVFYEHDSTDVYAVSEDGSATVVYVVTS